MFAVLLATVHARAGFTQHVLVEVEAFAHVAADLDGDGDVDLGQDRPGALPAGRMMTKMREEVIMRTTLDVDVAELDEIVRLTGASSRSAAVAAGLRALRERLALRTLADLVERLPAVPAEAAPRRRS